jgi:hypothetical protein
MNRRTIVVFALEFAVDHLAQTQPHPPMRADVGQGRRAAIRAPEYHHLPPTPLDPHGLVGQLLTEQYRMPMIYTGHSLVPRAKLHNLFILSASQRPDQTKRLSFLGSLRG